MRASWMVCAMIVVLPWLAACADSMPPPKPPISLPFSVEKAGNKVETGLQLAEERYYTFSLKLNYREGDQEDRKRVGALAGNPGVDDGIPIPLRLKIALIDAGGERTIVEKQTSSLELWAWGGHYFVKLIYGEKLAPGRYRVSLENLRDIPELDGVPVTFDIAFGHAK